MCEFVMSEPYVYMGMHSALTVFESDEGVVTPKIYQLKFKHSSAFCVSPEFNS